IEVTDARGERLPVPTPDAGADAGGESGRGLLLVASLADAWGCESYPPGGKTVWAECARRVAVRRCPGPPSGSGTTSVSR
ncbi:ATP-binding protein, partial [Streptomyces sp. NPDC005009]